MMSKHSTYLEEYLEELLEIITIKDEYTKNHSDNVRAMAIELGPLLGIKSEYALDLLGRAAWLHDIGKIIVSKTILCKPSPLDASDLRVMNMHPLYGAELVRVDKRYGATISPIILYHHEWVDGSGQYGLFAGEIPRFSRIISIVDAYDAMVSDRPYREPRTVEFIQSEFCRYSGSQFDRQILCTFFGMMGWHADCLCQMGPVDNRRQM